MLYYYTTTPPHLRFSIGMYTVILLYYTTIIPQVRFSIGKTMRFRLSEDERRVQVSPVQYYSILLYSTIIQYYDSTILQLNHSLPAPDSHPIQPSFKSFVLKTHLQRETVYCTLRFYNTLFTPCHPFHTLFTPCQCKPVHTLFTPFTARDGRARRGGAEA